jgi:GMP synthase (glutamine-hydrolysing)
MEQKKILILDYSVDRLETPTIKSCLTEKNWNVSSLFIDTEASFPDDLIEKEYTHIIHTGSALSIQDKAPFTEKAIQYIQDARDKGIWQMGICYGHQLVCKALVGSHAVRSSPHGFEVGWGSVNFVNNAEDILHLNGKENVWQHHFDEVVELPEGSEVLATNDHSAIQAYINYNERLLGTQFHPEFTKEAGDAYFLHDRTFIEENHVDVDELVMSCPSFDTAKVFFTYFLSQE